MVAAVDTILRFFNPVEPLQPNAQAFPQLPDEVRARVMRAVVEGFDLPGGVVEIYVTISNGRTELLAPAVRVPDRRAPVWQRLQVAVKLERSVTVPESGIVAQTADAMAINAKYLGRVVGSEIQAAAEINAPPENVLTVPRDILRPNVTEEGAELHMAEVGFFEPRIEAQVWHRSQGRATRVR